ncbi:MAG: site-specific DNA-methyltransferase, partial [Pseudomonadota bacterium]
MTVTILIGDARAQLATMPDDSVDCVVTSPPYWGLRDYGVAGQIGLEASLGEHIAVLVEVFRSVRRVMKPEASLWLNYGDCYASAPNGRSAASTKAAGKDDRTFRDKPVSTVGGALKPKDLCLMPYRLAIALQEDGWWVRSDIVWAKPNAMPDSSGRYRPSAAHEQLFLLTKSAHAFYDSAAVRMPMQASSVARLAQNIDMQQGSLRAYAGKNAARPMKAVGRPSTRKRGVDPRHEGGVNHKHLDDVPRGEGRLLRNYEPDLAPLVPPPVWEIATAAYSDAHFATFPPALVVPCILATCPPGGVVLDPFGG